MAKWHENCIAEKEFQQLKSALSECSPLLFVIAAATAELQSCCCLLHICIACHNIGENLICINMWHFNTMRCVYYHNIQNKIENVCFCFGWKP